MWGEKENMKQEEDIWKSWCEQWERVLKKEKSIFLKNIKSPFQVGDHESAHVWFSLYLRKCIDKVIHCWFC